MSTARKNKSVLKKKDMDTFEKKMNDTLTKLEKQICKTQGQIQWQFQKSKLNESSLIEDIEPDSFLFARDDNHQVLYSSEHFNSGKHYYWVKFEDIDFAHTGFFYIGIIRDHLKDIRGYNHSQPNACIMG